MYISVHLYHHGKFKNTKDLYYWGGVKHIIDAVELLVEGVPKLSVKNIANQKNPSKMAIKRKSQGYGINEPATQESQVFQAAIPDVHGKGKEKVGGPSKKVKLVKKKPECSLKIGGSENMQAAKKTSQPRKAASEGKKPRRSGRIKKKNLFSNTEDTAVVLDED